MGNLSEIDSFSLTNAKPAGHNSNILQTIKSFQALMFQNTAHEAPCDPWELTLAGPKW